MKKTWVNAEVEALDVKETAFGLTNPDTPDSEKTQITIGDREGWQQLYGEGVASAQ